MNNANLYANLRAAFPADLDRIAVETDNGLQYSWRDIDRASAMMANLLQGLKLPAGSRVAVQVEKSVEAMMLYLATLRAGLVFLPLNTAYQAPKSNISSPMPSQQSSSAARRILVGSRKLRSLAVRNRSSPWAMTAAALCSIVLRIALIIIASRAMMVMTWPLFCTPAAPQAAAKARCSRTAICYRTL